MFESSYQISNLLESVAPLDSFAEGQWIHFDRLILRILTNFKFLALKHFFVKIIKDYYKIMNIDIN